MPCPMHHAAIWRTSFEDLTLPCPGLFYTLVWPRGGVKLPPLTQISSSKPLRNEFPAATPLFSTTPDSPVPLPALSDAWIIRTFKMADSKPEEHRISGMEWDIRKIPTANPVFSSNSDYFETISTLPDTVRHRRTARSQNHFWFSLTSWVMDIGRSRAVSAVSYLSLAWSKIGISCWNRIASSFCS